MAMSRAVLNCRRLGRPEALRKLVDHPQANISEIARKLVQKIEEKQRNLATYYIGHLEKGVENPQKTAYTLSELVGDFQFDGEIESRVVSLLESQSPDIRDAAITLLGKHGSLNCIDNLTPFTQQIATKDSVGEAIRMIKARDEGATDN